MMESIDTTDTSPAPTLDNELLGAFVAVVDNGGFTAAGRQLHKTQSTISARVRTLEERLQVRLLERSSRRVALTPDGATFLVYARRLLQLQREAMSVVGRGGRGVIRFGVPENYAETWLPGLLDRFAELHPGIQPHIHCRMSSELLDALADGQLDLVLAVCYGSRPTGEPLGTEELVWAAHQSFRPDPGAPLPLALFPDDCPYRRRALNALALADRPWTLEYTTQSPTGLRAAVNQGSVVTVTDRLTLPECWHVLGEPDGLPPLPPTELELHRSPSFQHPAGDDLVALLRERIGAET
jgi:DNA-binding transcriptional LysR family regulator